MGSIFPDCLMMRGRPGRVIGWRTSTDDGCSKYGGLEYCWLRVGDKGSVSPRGWNGARRGRRGEVGGRWERPKIWNGLKSGRAVNDEGSVKPGGGLEMRRYLGGRGPGGGWVRASTDHGCSQTAGIELRRMRDGGA